MTSYSNVIVSNEHENVNDNDNIIDGDNKDKTECNAANKFKDVQCLSIVVVMLSIRNSDR